MKEIKMRVWQGKRFDYFTLNNILTYKEAFGAALINGRKFDLFTGRHDKNGAEIFDGDIVKARLYNGMGFAVVRWDESGCFLIGWHGGSSTKKRPMLIQKSVEVVGNIYENKVESFDSIAKV